MNRILNRFATPFTLGLFAVSTISGVALFFHWVPPLFHSMHEWLSMLLLLPFVLHIWKNWAAFTGYIKRKTIWVPLVVSLVVALPFAYAGFNAGGGGNPAFRAVGLMTRAPLTEVAPLLDTTPEALLDSLQQQGFQASSTDQTLGAVAAASGTPANELLFSLLPRR